MYYFMGLITGCVLMYSWGLFIVKLKKGIKIYGYELILKKHTTLKVWYNKENKIKER